MEPILTQSEAAFLGPLLPRVPWQVEVRISDLPGAGRYACFAKVLTMAGAAAPGEIVIDPDFFEPGTASFLALFAHEWYHQWQYARDPNFLPRYRAAESERVRRGESVLGNPYERAAYEFELKAFKSALARGYPRGSYTPLLVGRG